MKTTCEPECVCFFFFFYISTVILFDFTESKKMSWFVFDVCCFKVRNQVSHQEG